MSEAAGSGRRQSPAEAWRSTICRAYVISAGARVSFVARLPSLSAGPSISLSTARPSSGAPFRSSMPIARSRWSCSAHGRTCSLMTLFFLLSGLFVWPGERCNEKASRILLPTGCAGCALPFALSVALLMPVAQYPTYLQTAASPGVADYLRHFLALPFWPCGPMWFLWLLLCADLVAVGLHAVAPRWGEWLARLSSAAGARLDPFGISRGSWRRPPWRRYDAIGARLLRQRRGASSARSRSS